MCYLGTIIALYQKYSRIKFSLNDVEVFSFSLMIVLSTDQHMASIYGPKVTVLALELPPKIKENAGDQWHLPTVFL